jgi:hypothetical protein
MTSPTLMTVEVEPTIATGTLMVKARLHSQVWAPRTAELAAMSCPRSHTENETLSMSELGMRLSRASNLSRE